MTGLFGLGARQERRGLFLFLSFIHLNKKVRNQALTAFCQWWQIVEEKNRIVLEIRRKCFEDQIDYSEMKQEKAINRWHKKKRKWDILVFGPVYRTPLTISNVPILYIAMSFSSFCTHYFPNRFHFERIGRSGKCCGLRRLPFYLYRDIMGCKKWKGFAYEKKLSVSLHPVIFSTVGTISSHLNNRLQSFIWQMICRNNWFNNSSRQSWHVVGILWNQ